jgi:ribosomal protein S13
MKFEQLLQIYWSRSFLYGGKVKNFNITLKTFINDLSGINAKFKINLIKRFEYNYLFFKKNELFITLPLNQRKIINMYLSQIISINNNIFELIRYNLIRLYLIKTFKGRCHALGKPVRGQRTWSNSSNSYKCNKIIRSFISQVKKNNVSTQKPKSLNKKWIKKKLKKKALKIKMIITKKQQNLWF